LQGEWNRDERDERDAGRKEYVLRRGKSRDEGAGRARDGK